MSQERTHHERAAAEVVRQLQLQGHETPCLLFVLFTAARMALEGADSLPERPQEIDAPTRELMELMKRWMREKHTGGAILWRLGFVGQAAALTVLSQSGEWPDRPRGREE
jgi:hypothetical protein